MQQDSKALPSRPTKTLLLNLVIKCAAPSDNREKSTLVREAGIEPARLLVKGF